ncbi:hypothetical protein PSPL106493_18500 [Pseudomonas plecoglossicida]
MGLIQLDLGIHVALGMHDDLLGAGLVLEAEEVGLTAVALHRPGQEAALGLVRRQRPRRVVGAVVQAAHDQRAVGVAVEEHHHHFVADTRDLDAAEAAAGAGLGDADPAGAVVVELALAVPVELQLHAAQLVGEDLFTGRADDDGGLRAVDQGLAGAQLRAVGDLLAHADEAVQVTGLVARHVVVAAAVLHAQQQELTVLGIAHVVGVVLGQFEGVAGFHGPAVAVTVEGLAHQFERFDTVAHHGFAVFVGAVGVLPREVVDLELVHVALIVEALHGHRKEVARLAIVEGANGDLPGLQLPGCLPLGDRVGGFGHRRGVEADLRLFGQWHQGAGVIGDDHQV